MENTNLLTLEKSSSPEFFPPTEKYELSPIWRERRGVPASHETNLLFENSYIKVTLPERTSRGLSSKLNPFRSIEERKYLEQQLGEDLNPSKTTNNFFDNYWISLGKMTEVLDSSIPEQLLQIRVLQANKNIICCEAFNRVSDIKIEYTHSLLPLGEKVKILDLEEEMEDTINHFFLKLKGTEEERTELLSFLAMYKQSIPPDSTVQFIRSEAKRIAKSDKLIAYNVIKNPDKKYYILFDTAVRMRVLLPTDEGYIIKGQRLPFAKNKEEAIKFLKDPNNVADLTLIRSLIKEIKETHK